MPLRSRKGRIFEQFSPGVRFSEKVPLIYGPGNLSGCLPGNFIGPENAFLKAPGLFSPDIFGNLFGICGVNSSASVSFPARH